MVYHHHHKIPKQDPIRLPSVQPIYQLSIQILSS